MIADRLDALLRAIPTDPTRLVAAPSVTAERKKRKKGKNKRRKKNKNGQTNIFVRCQAQVTPCGDFLRISCGTDPICDAVIACCDSLATCAADDFLLCLNTVG